MLPVLQGRVKSPRETMFWERQGEYGARVGNWKLVDSRRGGGLFDLSEDPGESNDLSAELPAVRERVESRYLEWVRQMAEAEPRGPFRDF